MTKNEERKIIEEKIRKLLSLSTSDNVNEAKVALRKARQIMAKYNIGSINERKEEYVKTGIIRPKKGLLNWEIELASIVSRYYFVALVRSKEANLNYLYPLYSLYYIGDSLSIKLAEYAFKYFVTYYGKCFRSTNLLRKDSNARLNFYKGLNQGLYKSLFVYESEDEKALVVSAEGNIEKILEGKNFGKGKIKKNLDENYSIQAAGFEEGKKIKISQGVEHKEAENKSFLITHHSVV